MDSFLEEAVLEPRAETAKRARAPLLVRKPDVQLTRAERRKHCVTSLRL